MPMRSICWVSLAFQTGHYDAAIELIGRAVAITPSVAAYHCNLGESYRRAGQPERALESFRLAIARESAPGRCSPQPGPAYSSARSARRGDRGLPAGDRDQARLCRAHNSLGIVFYQTGRFEEAIAACSRAVALQPDFAEAYYQPRQCPEGQRPARRGDRRPEPGRCARARPCGGPQQPGNGLRG